MPPQRVATVSAYYSTHYAYGASLPTPIMQSEAITQEPQRTPTLIKAAT